MSKNAFNPRTRKQDEREILRRQEDFSSGLFKDVPASKVPENSVVDLKNMKNMGSYLEARSGSREWGDYSTYTASAPLPSIVTGIEATSTVSGSERTITIVSGYTPTEDSVGDWFVHDDGTHELITDYVSSTEIITDTDSSEAKDSTSAWVRNQVNCIYFHNSMRLVVLLIGQNLYISNDYTMTSWTEVTFVGTALNKPLNSVSQMAEFDNILFLFNQNGIYKLYLDQSPYLLYKINCANPEGLPSATPYMEVETSEYIRRYTYTNVRLSGTGKRDRNTDGVVIEAETSNVSANESFKDYTSASNNNPIDQNPPRYEYEYEYPSRVGISNLNVSKDELDNLEQHYTHVGLYATLDVGEDGINPTTGRGNDPELYIWIADIPIGNCGTVDYAGYVLRANVDIGKTETVRVYNSGTSAYEEAVIVSEATDTSDTQLYLPISAFNSSNFVSYVSGTGDVVVVSSHGITQSGTPVAFTPLSSIEEHEIKENKLYYVTNITTNEFQIANTYGEAISGDFVEFTSDYTGVLLANFGQRNLFFTSSDYDKRFTISQDASGNVYQDPYTEAFDSGYIGKTLYLPSGNYRHITGFINASGVTVAESGVGNVLDSGTYALTDVSSVYATDQKPDDDLRTTIAGWTLNNRLSEPLPNSDIGCIVPGFMCCATRDENKMYYSPMPTDSESIVGYYNPAYHVANFKGSIRALRELPNMLVIYCAGSTHTMPINVIEFRTIEDLGISIPIIGGQNIVDDSIGLLDYGSLVNVDLGRHMMITNEPAIRVFDGYSYSENIASQRIMDELRSLNMATSAIYHSIIGYVFWGYNE